MAPTMDVKQTYNEAAKKLKEVSVLGGITGLLGWDEMVMLPPGAVECRGQQKEALAGVMFDKRTDAELGRLLTEVKAAIDAGQSGLSPHECATIRDAHKDFVRTTAIPKDLAQAMAKLETEAYVAWVQAREQSDFSKFAPYLQQVREGLVPLIQAIKAKGAASIDDSIVKGEFDVDKQAALCKQVALDIGFSLEKGRLDVSVHPFTGGAHSTDVRMTTRFKPDNVMEGLTGAIHETGHALYEQGRNLDYDGLPVNQALSMGVHESQSLLWERMVALSPPFASYLLPRLKETFPGKFDKATPDMLFRAANVVQDPSFIRVESDEVTYPMHVILRYEIERGLISGEIQVDDVPKIWNAKMQQYLGVTLPTEAKGCLQDVHWGAGLMGYFPTYTLGAIYACQQHSDLCKIISAKAVSIHPILLGVGGTIYTEHTMKQFKQLGLDHQRATRLAQQLHAHSVQYAHKLATTRRAIEHNNTSHSQSTETGTSCNPPDPH
ncbi:putative carboxypeptidase [Dunaliella salina]|uniref:Carboxypeptidase n=1 Tax=Dunaliella salina TaxID=3046 RepID=A0ABQ7G4L1_DUNSA|nr:putative carboxypeptidase [Dunaliella salina]|eukprot:KAF5829548.1 putative carboxypeptidase [Dunaliella salina]